MQPDKKLFGVALDASDDPMSLQLKWAAMTSCNAHGADFYSDPYDAAVAGSDNLRSFKQAGKFPVPSWLGPRPPASDLPRINSEHYQHFYDQQGFRKLSEEVCDFVKDRIFPDLPFMIGIDHSATGGVIAALAERYGAENLSVIVLDRHFDGIALAERLDAGNGTGTGAMGGMPFSDQEKDEYCCGSFWAHLVANGIVLPQHLSFIGVADYPRPDMGEEWRRFQESYLDFERRGSRFFPSWEFETPYLDRLSQFIDQAAATPYLYVSLDVDVGSLNCVHAARYMDGPGISRENLRHVAMLIAKAVDGGRTELVGLDIMEFNMHFLGIEMEDGGRDRTLDVVDEYIGALIPA